jgi:hypothetical protein
MSDPKPETAPAIGFSLSIQLTPAKSLVLQTHVDGACSDEQLNAALDKIVRAGDRIDDHYTIPLLEKSLEVEQRTLRENEKDLAAHDIRTEHLTERWGKGGKATPYRAPEQDTQKRQQIVTNIGALKEQVARTKTAIAKKRKVVYGDEHDGGADRSSGDSDR